MTTEQATVEIPTVLAFDRKLEPSDGLMYSGNWNDIASKDLWTKISLIDRRNRGVKSNFTREVLEDEEELQKQIQEPNPVWGDDALLPHDHDTLKLSFTLRVVGGLDKPSACNKSTYQDRLTEIVKEYSETYHFDELAKRFANNIANGRFLWRNRISGDELKILVSIDDSEEVIEFNGYDYDLKDVSNEDDDIRKLQQTIAAGLSGVKYVLLKVEAFVRLGQGQRVWPSQEMRMNIPKGEKSRYLFNINNHAAMHSQKIGNALRTIDNWYSEEAQPIAVEPFGSVTHRGMAMRKSRNDFNSLAKRWLVQRDENLTDAEKHFVIAVLIRGGVFSQGE